MKQKLFNATQFKPTQWESAEQKAKFANQMVRFIEGGFKPTLFPKWFYRRLSSCFGHIAHYDQGGFYATWFTTINKQRDFIENMMRFPCYGDPTFTYSDVERALQAWVFKNKLKEKFDGAVASATEAIERAQLAALRAKYQEAA